MEDSEKAQLLMMVILLVSVAAASFSVMHSYQASAAKDTNQSSMWYIDSNGDLQPDCGPNQGGNKISCHAFNDRNGNMKCDPDEILPQGLPAGQNLPVYTGSCGT